jgi:hypothetical protein
MRYRRRGAEWRAVGVMQLSRLAYLVGALGQNDEVKFIE